MWLYNTNENVFSTVFSKIRSNMFYFNLAAHQHFLPSYYFYSDQLHCGKTIRRGQITNREQLQDHIAYPSPNNNLRIFDD